MKFISSTSYQDYIILELGLFMNTGPTCRRLPLFELVLEDFFCELVVL